MPLLGVSARRAGNMQLTHRSAVLPPGRCCLLPLAGADAAAAGALRPTAATERTVLLTDAQMQTTLPGCAAPVLANAGGRGRCCLGALDHAPTVAAARERLAAALAQAQAQVDSA